MRSIAIPLFALLVALPCAGADKADQNAAKAVLVTGAGSGIGRKITERLATDGYFVYATARKEEELKALGAIRNVRPMRLDVTQPADIAAALETVTKAGRGLYGLVNNAGTATMGSVADMTLEEFDVVMKVNAYGPVMVSKAFEPLVIEAKGRIVNIGSVSGILASPNIAAYVMSKHAVEGFTDSLAAQLAPLGVQVSVVEPGAFRSSLDQKMLARMAEHGQSDVLKTYGSKIEPPELYPESDEVAAAVEQALFSSNPKRRYMVIPRHFRDPLNDHLAEETIRKQIEQLVQLNEGQPYTFDRAALIKMLDEALATARPRTD